MAPVGQRSAAWVTLSRKESSGSYINIYKNPSFLTSNTSGQTCIQVAEEAHTSKSTTTLIRLHFCHFRFIIILSSPDYRRCHTKNKNEYRFCNFPGILKTDGGPPCGKWQHYQIHY